MNEQGLAEALGFRVRGVAPVAGGDLNEAYRVELADGRRVFVKTSADALPGAFASEAAGLQWLADAGSELAVPRVLAVDEGFLALEWVEPGGRVDPELLGRGLAAVHRAGGEQHGMGPPGGRNRITFGALRLPPVVGGGWAPVYVQARLMPLVEQARDAGALSPSGAVAVEAVCERMRTGDLGGPYERPSRLHGDLWSGNVMGGADGRVYLIDPAAHGGHREMDLAMLELFGGPGPRFLDAYQEVYPLAEGHRDRVGLWQLFPLLVHTVLFGGGYGARVETVARSYVG